MILSLIHWAICISNLPLLFAMMMGLQCWQVQHTSGLFHPSLLGHCVYRADGVLILANQQREQVSFFITQVTSVCLVLRCHSGTRWIIWRDSCNDIGYRQLLAIEYRRQHRLRQFSRKR